MGLTTKDLPSNVIDSEVLTGHDLNRLLTHKGIPNDDEVTNFSREPEVSSILEFFTDDPEGRLTELHKLAKEFLRQGDLEKAWLTIMQC